MCHWNLDKSENRHNSLSRKVLYESSLPLLRKSEPSWHMSEIIHYGAIAIFEISAPQCKNLNFHTFYCHFLPDFHEILRLWKSNIIFHPKKYLWGYLKNCNYFITRVWKTWIDNVRSLGQSNFPIFCHICILHEERKSLRGKSMGTKAMPGTLNSFQRL